MSASRGALRSIADALGVRKLFQAMTPLLLVAALVLGGVWWFHGRSASGVALSVEQIAQPIPPETQQLVVVHAAGSLDTVATLETFDRTADGWKAVHGPVTARLGRSGFSDHHREGDGSTPIGVFAMTQAFGIKADPGAKLPYRQVGPADWWISDTNTPALYNTWQTEPVRWDRASSEHLIDKGVSYDYVSVIDYNRFPQPVVGDGSAIFLHVTNGKPTSGCVAIDESTMRDIVKWLDPTKHPRIVMGPDDWMFSAYGAPSVVGTTAGGLSVLPPTRVLDTRTTTGAVGPGGFVDLPIRGVANVPPDASAVALNVTITDATAATFVKVWPTPVPGDVIPDTSNLNVNAGETRASMVVSRIGVGGQVRIENASGSAQFVADVVGYVSPTSPGRYEPVTPYRILDTRSARGVPGNAPVAAGSEIEVSVPFAAEGASAVVLNVTATEVSESTFVAAFGGSSVWTGTSTMNPARASTTPNLAIVPLGPNNTIKLRNQYGNVHLVADVEGFVSTRLGERYVPAAYPVRVLDTRQGIAIRGRVGKEAVTIVVPGLPQEATAVALTLTAANASTATYVKAEPNTGGTDVSNLNLGPTDGARANLVIVAVGSDRLIRLTNGNGAVDLVADISGWFVP